LEPSWHQNACSSRCVPAQATEFMAINLHQSD
jgi:hypothetical protein